MLDFAGHYNKPTFICRCRYTDIQFFGIILKIFFTDLSQHLAFAGDT